MPEVIINGPEGRLEGRYHHAEINAPIAVVLHPHPEQGGNMNNKVAYALYRGFAQCNFNVLRFNFRGIGHSEGIFDNGEGELNDAAAVLDWLQSYNPNASACWVGGYAFGSWVAMQLLMRRPEIDGFVAISPPANHHDFSFLAPCPVSGLFIQGDKDRFVDPASVKKLAMTLTNQRNITITERTIRGADHSYETHLPQIVTHVQDYIIGQSQGQSLKIA